LGSLLSSGIVSRRTIERVALAFGVVVLGFVLASATFVDRRPPGVARISVSSTAADGRTALTHATIDVEFTEPVERSSAEARFRITPSWPGALSWGGDRVLIFTPSRKLPIATEFAVHLERGFIDLKGNVAATDVPAFTFRTVDLPKVSTTLPLEGAADVPLDGVLTLTFDRLMDTELTAAAVQVTPNVPLAPSWSGTSLLLTPTASLVSGTSYELTVGRQAADVDGNGLTRPFVLRFRTVTTGLLVRSLVPADGSAGVGPLSPIAITFDRPIDPASIAGALTITPPVDGTLEVVGLPRDAAPAVGQGPGPSVPVPSGSLGSESPPSESPSEPLPSESPPSESPSEPPPSDSTPPGASGSPPASSPSPVATPVTVGPTRVLRFRPNGPLAAHTTFTVRLRPGAVRALGAAQVAEGRTWTFTTGSVDDQLQNQIVFLSARAGVTNVWAMNPDGTNARQLTVELTPVTSYDVAVDGRTLVYATAGTVRRLSMPGGAVMTLSRAEDADYQPELRPGAGSMIVTRRDRLAGGDLGLWLMPVADGAPPETRILAPGCLGRGSVAPPFDSSEAAGDVYAPEGRSGPWSTSAAFSGDGSQLLVACFSGDMVRLDLTAHTSTLLPLKDPVGVAAWSPSHDAFLVAAAGPSGRAGTWFVGRTGLVAPGPDLEGWPAADAAGGIAGTSQTDPGRLAYQVPGDGLRILTLAIDLADRQPVFSPAGDAILFVRVASDDPGRSAGLWLVAPDGRELRQLSPTGSDPRWLP
jgi:hypothetical protein